MLKMIKIFLRIFYIIYLFFKLKVFLYFINKKSIIFKYLDIEKKNLKLFFELLGPVFIKFGQILSTRKDFFDNKTNQYLEKLQNNVSFSNFNDIKLIIEDSLKLKISDFFIKVNENPISSASLAQIHSAILKNGDRVIVKVLKPNIKNIVYLDLFILKFFLFIFSVFYDIKRFKIFDIISELESIFDKELKLSREASFISKFQCNFSSSVKFYSPKIYWDFCSENVLTLEYIDGIHILNKDKLFRENIKLDELIYNLFECFYIQFLKYNFFHADLHPGNILISKNESYNFVLVFFDFGIVSFISNNEKIYLIENILAFINRDYKKIILIHLKAKTISDKIDINTLESDLRFIFDPVLNKSLKKISFKKFINNIRVILGYSNTQLQPRMLLFQKTLIFLESIARDLNNEINLWNVSRRIIENIFIGDLLFFRLYNNIIFLNENKIDNDEKESFLFLFIRLLLSNIFLIILLFYSLFSLLTLLILYYYNYVIYFL